MPDDYGDDLRARLLDAALAIVATQGTPGLTVRAVAKAAGCSTMGVYTHFHGKGGLIDAVVQRGVQSLSEELDRAFEVAGGGPEGLEGVARAYRAWALAHPSQFQAMFVPAPGLAEDAETGLDLTAPLFDAHRSRVAAVYGGPHADPEAWRQEAARLWATVHGHVMIELLRTAHGQPLGGFADFDSAVAAAVRFAGRVDAA